jgi:hypothetical protein
MPTTGVVRREAAEQRDHLDAVAYPVACLVAYPVATNLECVLPEVHHRMKWDVLQREALDEH